ncbi:hypothetical protein DITRI_Ditri09bG0070100 [Diplodiscus trichospermus]
MAANSALLAVQYAAGIPAPRRQLRRKLATQKYGSTVIAANPAVQYEAIQKKTQITCALRLDFCLGYSKYLYIGTSSLCRFRSAHEQNQSNRLDCRNLVTKRNQTIMAANSALLAVQYAAGIPAPRRQLRRKLATQKYGSTVIAANPAVQYEAIQKKTQITCALRLDFCLGYSKYLVLRKLIT